MLAAKAGGGEALHGAEPATPTAPVVDLMAALQASIAETEVGRKAAEKPTRKTTARNAAAKKTPAKRAPRKAG